VRCVLSEADHGRYILILTSIHKGEIVLGRRWLAFSLAVLFVLGIIGTASAHGVKTEQQVFVEDGVVKIEIRATYDTGDPMSEAQVVIFAPNDLANPWKTGKTDNTGSFTFTPDLSIPGTWDVQVRLAGHGKMIHIEITGDEASTLESDAEEMQAREKTAELSAANAGVGSSTSVGTGFTTIQIVIMAASVIWGCIGTALFFARRRNK